MPPQSQPRSRDAKPNSPSTWETLLPLRKPVQTLDHTSYAGMHKHRETACMLITKVCINAATFRDQTGQQLVRSRSKLRQNSEVRVRKQAADDALLGFPPS
jgi:hypothetical protein